MVLSGLAKGVVVGGRDTDCGLALDSEEEDDALVMDWILLTPEGTTTDEPLFPESRSSGWKLTTAKYLSPLLELDGRFCGAQPPPPPEHEASRVTPGVAATAAARPGGRFSFMARSSQPNEGTA